MESCQPYGTYLGSTVHSRKRGWNKTGHTGSEDDATLLFGSDQFRGEMVGNVDRSRGIAFIETNEAKHQREKMSIQLALRVYY